MSGKTLLDIQADMERGDYSSFKELIGPGLKKMEAVETERRRLEWLKDWRPEGPPS